MTDIRQVGALSAMVVALVGACGGSGDSRPAGAVPGAGDSAPAAAAAAGPTERKVSNVMIGRHIGGNDRITEPTFDFAPLDTVHISVATEGAGGAATLTAAWRSQNGEILQQSTEPVRPAGENTEFHLSSPKGLKPGTYKVIVFLGSDSVDTKVFVVRK